MNQMMGLIGRKLGMTQFFRDDGECVPVTLIQSGPCTVLQVKLADGADGYNAVQVGFGAQKDTRVSKALKGHYAKAGAGVVRVVREFRVTKETAAAFKPGQTVQVTDLFKEGDRIDVVGTSKGRGFAGVMKRHNFKGFIRTHGTHEYFRHGGSVGTRLTPGMTLKGKKMPGHMGSERVTIQNLKVEKIDAENHVVMLRGGVPGPNGATVLVRKQVKVPPPKKK